MNSKSKQHSAHSHGKADYIGIFGSVLCLVHCLVTPVIALGSTFTIHQHSAGGLSFDYFFILINGIAVYYATREHQVVLLRLVLWGSFALFTVSLLLETYNPVFQFLGYIGSALLILGHGYNLFYCRPWIWSKN
jgi:hypothetical protein